MADEGSFLRAILANPADDLPRLVYADWLDEQETERASSKAVFLRVTATLVKLSDPAARKKLEEQLGKLARYLPTDWLPVVSRLVVENCAAAGNTVRRPLETITFDYECPLKWEALTPTDDVTVRHCKACRQNVYYCDTIGEARDHARQGHCVAVDAALPRAEGDLRELPLWTLRTMGRPSPTDVELEKENRRRGQEAERISEERERRK
jgi:uncharacterized protein (TIGR02996 family)